MCKSNPFKKLNNLPLRSSVHSSRLSLSLESTMILKASQFLSPPTSLISTAASSPSASLLRFPLKSSRNWPTTATAGAGDGEPITGVVFQPFEELRREVDLVPSVLDQSLARQKYPNDCESAINEQIKWALLNLCFY